MIEILRKDMKKCNISKCRKYCSPHATGPMSNQAGQRSVQNTIALLVRLDMSLQIRLPIGSMDKSLVSMTIWDLPI